MDKVARKLIRKVQIQENPLAVVDIIDQVEQQVSRVQDSVMGLQESLNEAIASKIDGKDGESIVGPQGERGEKGEKGDKGDTGERGPAGIDGKDGKSIIGPKGDPGKDGIDGKDGKDGINPDPKEVIEEIKKLKGNDRLDISNIRNGEQLLRKILKYNNDTGGGGGDLAVKDEGIEVTPKAYSFNFTGGGVTATSDTNGNVTVDVPSGGGGTVTSVSVATANGFSGTVTNPTTTPAITINSSVFSTTDFLVYTPNVNLPNAVAISWGDYLSVTGTATAQTIAVVPNFSDSDFRIHDNTDTTKVAVFEASGITTGTTRTYTFPDASGTLALTSDILSPGGSDGAVQYNNGGAFGGFGTFNDSTNALTLPGNVDISTNIYIGHALRSDASDGVLIEAANGTDVGIFGAGNTANALFYGGVNINGALNSYSTATFAPTSDIAPVVLKAGGTSTSIYTAEYRDSGNILWGYIRKRILSDANQGAEFTFNTSGTGATSRTGFLVTMNAGYTGAEFTNALTFDNAVAGTATYYTADGTVYGYRASGNRGGGGFARGVTTGHNVGWMVLAGGGAVNYALWASSTITKSSAINVGVLANAYNATATSPAYIGLYATIYNSNTAPPNMAGVKTALLADNQTFAADIGIFRDNGTIVFNVCDYGLIVSTQVANTSGAANFWTVTSAANTGRTASTEVVNLLFNLSAEQTWAAGSITTQREVLFRYPSYSFASASTITNAATVAIEGAPLAGTNATITNPYALWVQAGTSRFDGKTALGGVVAPTALLHLAAGTASANTAPLKFTTGTSLTSPEAGAMEFTTDDLYFTISTGPARKGVVLNDGTNLTSGRVPFATTNGRLTDDADFTFATDTLTVTKIVGTTSIKVGTVAGYISSDGSTGATGSFTTVDGKTVTVKDGIITQIV